jgi:hypothetical protein
MFKRDDQPGLIDGLLVAAFRIGGELLTMFFKVIGWAGRTLVNYIQEQRKKA